MGIKNLFKKKNTNDGIIYNMDNEPVCNVETGTFLMNFSYDQQNVIKKFLDSPYHYPIKSFAYTHVPAEYMEELYELYSKYFMCRDLDLDVWKLVHTDYTYDQFIWAVKALPYHMNFSDRFENVSEIPVSALQSVATALQYHIDLSQMVDEKDYKNLAEKASEIKKKYDKRNEICSRIDDLITVSSFFQFP